MNVLQQACMLSNESFMSTIPDIVPEPQYSKKHIRTMNKLLNKMRDNRYHYFTTGTVRVLIAAAIIFSLVVSAFAIPSVREYVITKFNTHSVFRAVSTEDSQYVTDLTVGYIPEGFELVEEDENRWEYTYLLYDETDDCLIINKTTKFAEIGFDIEEAPIKTVVSNGIEYILYEDYDNHYGVVWYCDSYVYYIEGNVCQEELLKIAYRIK